MIAWPDEAVDIQRLRDYVPVIAIFIVSNVFRLLRLPRLYHLVRATSRVDEFYAIVGRHHPGHAAGRGRGIADPQEQRLRRQLAAGDGLVRLGLGARAGHCWAAGSCTSCAASCNRKVLCKTACWSSAPATRPNWWCTKFKARLSWAIDLLGLVATQRRRAGAGVAGLPVLGCTEDLPRLIDEQRHG